jgi:hypothetical protein
MELHLHSPQRHKPAAAGEVGRCSRMRRGGVAQHCGGAMRLRGAVLWRYVMEEGRNSGCAGLQRHDAGEGLWRRSAKEGLEIGRGNDGMRTHWEQSSRRVNRRHEPSQRLPLRHGRAGRRRHPLNLRSGCSSLLQARAAKEGGSGQPICSGEEAGARLPRGDLSVRRLNSRQGGSWPRPAQRRAAPSSPPFPLPCG